MILVVTGDAGELVERIGAGVGVVSPELVTPEMLSAEILLADPVSAAAIIPRLPHLRWVQSTWAGVEPILRAGIPEGVTLTSVKNVFGPQMSEFVFGHLLAHTQEVVDRTLARTWNRRIPRRLQGSRMGILGTGSIGTALAVTARHFGMEVVGCSRGGAPRQEFDRVFPVSRRLEFATDLDHLVVVLPATGDTVNLVDAELLARLGPGATLVNVGRGITVDTDAVVEALGTGRLAHAVLDVLPVEPLPDDSPWWRVTGLVITSHTAADSHPADIAVLFLENLDRHRSGRPLIGVVDPVAGY